MESVLIITNLYPSSWDPSRATFNKQQFDRLAKYFSIKILVPVAWPQWLKLSAKEKSEGEGMVRYRPFFYTPKIGYSMFSVFMLISLIASSGRWIRKQKPAALLASWAYPEGVATALLAKIIGCPFFIKVHGSDVNDFGNDKWRAKQIVWAANRAAGVFVVSDALRTRLISLGVAADKLHLIYNGVDNSVFYPVANKQIGKLQRLLYVGNLKANKGVMELIQSFIALLELQPGTELVIAGEGVMGAPMKQLLEQAGVQDKVKFLGSIAHSQVADEIRQAQIVVLPSYAEGVPNILLEAMACGKPVVATTVGGIPEIVTDKTSILIPEKTIEPLTNALDQALQKSWSQSDIVEHASQFDWQRNVNQVQQIIEQTLKNNEDKSVVSI
ncbi:glycosyltransferase family 4 protein [Thalassotalea litorea]|uniref:Glycosyltransferase family 4 protein n=1 Tax=Thalassotalea litorea TaxID=2020715 RepID=A0A5R9IMF5_9GAMM|nr:glycosyltransferase family 4 protein [Thalassotalea litorea]TLU65769.1 glycosyltransferase family 4 protein [Thalassotalea litorea]